MRPGQLNLPLLAKCNISRLDVSQIDPAASEGCHDRSHTRPVLFELLFLFGNPFGVNVLRVLRSTIQLGSSKIQHEGGLYDTHFDDEESVVISQHAWNPAIFDVVQIVFRQPAVDVSLTAVKSLELKCLDGRISISLEYDAIVPCPQLPDELCPRGRGKLGGPQFGISKLGGHFVHSRGGTGTSLPELLRNDYRSATECECSLSSCHAAVRSCRTTSRRLHGRARSVCPRRRSGFRIDCRRVVHHGRRPHTTAVYSASAHQRSIAHGVLHTPLSRVVLHNQQVAYAFHRPVQWKAFRINGAGLWGQA